MVVGRQCIKLNAKVTIQVRLQLLMGAPGLCFCIYRKRAVANTSVSGQDKIEGEQKAEGGGLSYITTSKKKRNDFFVPFFDVTFRFKMCSIQNVNTLGGSSNKLPTKFT
jgi:hypothetical protein